MVEGVGWMGGTMTVILSGMRYESFKRYMRPRIQVSEKWREITYG